MRKIFLSTILFCLPIVATAGVECPQQSIQPSEDMIQAVQKGHPELDSDEQVAVARMYQIAHDQRILANGDEASDEVRVFAVRTGEIAVKLLAIQITAFKAIPEMKAVLERMKEEKAAGLKEVSPELKPKVRRAASTMVVIGEELVNLGNEITKLASDQLVAAKQKPRSIPDRLADIERAMCTMEKTVNIAESVAGIYTTALALTFVENLRYE